MRPVPTYTDEEIREIFHRALLGRGEGGEGGIEHAALVEAAREVGIAPADLERAAAEVRAAREQTALVQQAETETARAVRRRRRAFVRHLGTYLVVMAGLVALDLATGPGTWWFYPAIGWGIGIALDGFSALTFDRERVFEKKLRKLERKRARALGEGTTNRHRSDVALALRELDRSANKTAAHLMRALARKLDELDAKISSHSPR